MKVCIFSGFTDIVLEDQMRLLQSTWGEILTLGLAFRSMANGGTRLHFATDLIVDENAAKDLQADDLYYQVGLKKKKKNIYIYIYIYIYIT